MEKYYDMPLTLEVIISVKAESKDQAKKKIVDIPNSELLEIVKEQSVFFDDNFESCLAH